MNIANYKFASAIALILGFGAANASTLYVTNGDSSRLAIVDTSTGTMTGTASTSRGAYPIAIQNSSIWLGHYYGTGGGTEYDLSGTATGNIVSGDVIRAVDGASDGTFNYALTGSFGSSGSVVRTNEDWSNSQTMFNVSSSNGRLVGIAYDTMLNSLWLSDRYSIYNYSLAGDLLGSFAHTSNDGGALAYDQLTDTLWMVARGSTYQNGTILQYNKNGNVLNTTYVSGLSSNNWGAEFSTTAVSNNVESVPVPAPLALMIASLAWVGYQRRKNGNG